MKAQGQALLETLLSLPLLIVLLWLILRIQEHHHLQEKKTERHFLKEMESR